MNKCRRARHKRLLGSVVARPSRLQMLRAAEKAAPQSNPKLLMLGSEGAYMADTTSLTFLGRLRAKDPKEWEKFHKTIGKSICAATKRWLGNQCPHIDHDDIAQECYLKLLKMLPAYEHQGKGSFRAWVNVIVRHGILAPLRRKPPVGWSAERLKDLFDQLEDSRSSVEIVELADLHASIVAAIVERNGTPLSEVRLLLDGQTEVAEAARILGCTEQLVHLRRSRLRAKLSRQLKEFGELVE